MVSDGQGKIGHCLATIETRCAASRGTIQIEDAFSTRLHPGFDRRATDDEARVNSNCRSSLRVRFFPQMARGLRGERLKRSTRFMKFTLEVGSTEKHLIEFNFNQLYGTLVINVDDRSIFQSTRLFNEPVQEVYHFVIDGREKSDVRIEKRRKPLFGHRNAVYVNNRLTQVIDRYF